MNDNGDQDALKQYLQGLSDRLRSYRAQRGISRRTLSRLTGISDRYLSRLEQGQANPSMGILWRIAGELDIALHQLVSEQPLVTVPHQGLFDTLQRLGPDNQESINALLNEHFPPPSHHYLGVAFIGLRAAGKSTLAGALSERLGVPHVRLGRIIEQLAGMDLPEVFSLGGQKSFRRLERQAVEHVIREHEGILLEAGGSVVSELETFNLLQTWFYTVWIKATPEEHMHRVVSQGDLRPLQSTSEATADLKRILAEREPRYSQADYVLDTTGRDVEDCVEELVGACRAYLPATPRSPTAHAAR